MSKVTLLRLFVASLVFHIAGLIVSVVYMQRATKSANFNANLYEFYRPRVTGERVQTNSPFIEVLKTAYKTTCKDSSSIKDLLILSTSNDASLGLENFIQTWMPASYPLVGFKEVNGYWMLIVVFSMSIIFQIYFIVRLEKNIDFFQRPCLARWLEYAATSPFQVVLVASCVMIRDVHTIMLLFAAQLVCVLLGFPIEFALQNQRLATRMLKTLKDVKDKARDGPLIVWKQRDLREKAKYFIEQLEDVCNENEYEEQTDAEQAHLHDTEEASLNAFDNVAIVESKALIVPKTPASVPKAPVPVDFFSRVRAISRNIWIVCMFASLMLHVFVWFILISQLSSVLSESDCYDGDTSWQEPLQAVVYGQAVLFSLFALVPLEQKRQQMSSNSNSTSAIFLRGSLAYAILSVAAKTLLAITYIVFVLLFPFKSVSPNDL
jgi:hypothetical protein